MGEGFLDIGEHKLPFSFQLPENCPGSFEGSMGWIRYHLDVDLVTKAQSRIHFRYNINVEKLDDLNLHPEYKVSR